MKKWIIFSLIVISVILGVNRYNDLKENELPPYIVSDFEKDLFSDVSHVIDGTVLESSSRWVNESGRNEIMTIVSLSVNKYSKGSGESLIPVIYRGGVVGDIAQLSSVTPGGAITLKINQSYIIFADKINETHFQPKYVKPN